MIDDSGLVPVSVEDIDTLAAMKTLDELFNPALALAREMTVPTESGADLLDGVEGYLSRFVAYPNAGTRIAHVLWVAHAHRMDIWESTPRIAFLSAEPESGKTRALEVTELLVPRPVRTMNVSPAYMFRKMNADEGLPTILYDEIDTVFGPKAKGNEDIRGLINAGHRKGATVGRCVTQNKEILTEDFPAYCAVALSGIDDLPDTIMSRSVVVRMRRRAPGEHVEQFRDRLHAGEGFALRARLERWTQQIPTGVWPAMPSEITDRNADVWEPLLAVADAAGGTWPSRAREAAVTLVTDVTAIPPTLGVQLLTDLWTLFMESGQEKLFTRSIITSLRRMEEAPWGSLRGRPIDARRLGAMLRKYGITSHSVRIEGMTAKGYERADLHDDWSRYVPAYRSPAPQAALDASHPSQPSHSPAGVDGSGRSRLEGG